MNTLLLRMVGPMQSWGVQSRFSVRDTGLEPSKSAVLGLVCAAMGIERENETALASLASLKLGTRADREGHLGRDYHTALKVLKAGGGLKDCEPSKRYYLADAAFLVGLEGENLSLLQEVQEALQKPRWPLFLGRKAFVPSAPVYLSDGLRRDADLIEALSTYPYLSRGPVPERVRLVIEDSEGSIVRQDQPLSFAERRFAPRRVRVQFIRSPAGVLEEAV